MKKDIKLIALDMDGTLLNNKHKVSEENKRAIIEAREKGIEVIISTGRHFSTSSIIAKELDIHYLITVNGSEIWTMTGELIARQLIDPALVKKLVALQKKHNTWMWLTSTEEIFRGEAPEEIDAHEWLKFGYDVKKDDVRKEIMDELATYDDIELSNSSLTNIEVNAIGVNKAVAIEKVCERLGITMDNVMAMGDSLNDRKMIEQAGFGIAMDNAQPEVKKIADWVTDANHQDGVAKAIRRWVL